MTAATVEITNKAVICQECRARYQKPDRDLISPESSARAVGWVVWEGRTIGGREERRVFCPLHAGREPVDEAALVPKWDAVCRTCDAQASEEDGYDSEPFTEEDASNWRMDHRCEPWVDLIQPKRAEVAS